MSRRDRSDSALSPLKSLVAVGFKRCRSDKNILVHTYLSPLLFFGGLLNPQAFVTCSGCKTLPWMDFQRRQASSPLRALVIGAAALAWTRTAG